MPERKRFFSMDLFPKMTKKVADCDAILLHQSSIAVKLKSDKKSHIPNDIRKSKYQLVSETPNTQTGHLISSRSQLSRAFSMSC